MSKWVGWMDIEENPDFERCGVYKVRLVDSKGLPIEIPRFLDNDKDGILQISRSENIRKGINFFRGAIEGKKYANTEGKRLYLIKKYTNFPEIYMDCRLQYSFRQWTDKRETRIEQERLLKWYIKRYGEAPPINNYWTEKYIDWESLDYDESTDL
jgi:hypothetical protein